MNASTPTQSLLSRRSLLAGAAASVAASLLGCGGGDGLAGVGTGGTGSFSSGPIRGFGSIVVNGVRYDEASAQVVGDAGAAFSRTDLRLGMVVDVNGSDVTTSGTGQRRATATSISVRSEIEGPISTIDPGRGSFTVLGQQVQVTAATVFDDDLRGGLASLAVGQIVEVYGYQQAAGQYLATRIDDEDDTPTHYKLRGVVSGLDTTARSFRIGATLVSYAEIAGAVPGLANGQYARVELQLTPAASGAWRARRIQVAGTAIGVPQAGSVKAEIEGYITAFTSSARFSVHGVTVDASGVARLPTGLALGRLVEVEGVLANGVLVADSVEIEDDGVDDGKFEIEGAIASVSPGTRSFVVHGVTVDYATARFKGGTVEQLAAGVKVEVEGLLASDGTTVVATEIEFDD